MAIEYAPHNRTSFLKAFLNSARILTCAFLLAVIVSYHKSAILDTLRVSIVDDQT